MRTESKTKNNKHNPTKKFDINHQETGATNTLETANAKAASIEVSNEERHQLIAKAAYFRAEQRSFTPGQELEDWLKAEAEIEIQFSQIGMGDLRKNA